MITSLKYNVYYNTFVFHAVTLKDAKYYEVPSSSAEEPNRVVITFTTEDNKDYVTLLPPTTSTTDEPTSELFDVVVSTVINPYAICTHNVDLLFLQFLQLLLYQQGCSVSETIKVYPIFCLLICIILCILCPLCLH